MNLRKCRRNLEEPFAISVYNTNNTSNETAAIERSSTDLNEDFMHSQLFIGLLLRMNINEADKDELLELCK